MALFAPSHLRPRVQSSLMGGAGGRGGGGVCVCADGVRWVGSRFDAVRSWWVWPGTSAGSSPVIIATNDQRLWALGTLTPQSGGLLWTQPVVA